MFKQVSVSPLKKLKASLVIIRNHDGLVSHNIKINEPINFDEFILVGIIYTGGSRPKRIVENVVYDQDKELVTFYTNFKSITVTSLDLRTQCFFYKTPNKAISHVTLV